MIRLLQTVCLAAVAVAFAGCSESVPTAPQAAPAVSAAGDLVGLSAPAPDGVGHPIRSGSMTDTLSSAPDVAHVIGETIGVTVACNTPF